MKQIFTHTSVSEFCRQQDRVTGQKKITTNRPWKIQDSFEILMRTVSKFYNPSENLAIDEVIVLFRGRVIFRQYIPKKHKHFGIKIYKLCNSTGYTGKVHLRKDRQCTAQYLTATHATVTKLTKKIGHGHKLYMDNFFSSPDIFYNLTKKKNCCGTVRLNRKGMPEDLRCKTIKVRWGDIQVRTRCNLTAIDWMDKRDVCMLTNIHDPPQERNFRNEQRKMIKPKIVVDYNHHLGYVDKGNRMANSYTISHQTWK